MTIDEALEAVPTLLSYPKIVHNLDEWSQPSHYWHALLWLEGQRGAGEYTDKRVDDAKDKLERQLAGICRSFVRKFKADGSWRNRNADFWRSNQGGRPDDLHLFDTGALPPRIFCREDDEAMPDDLEDLWECFKEVQGWTSTPAAHGYFDTTAELVQMREAAAQMIGACDAAMIARHVAKLALETIDVEKSRLKAIQWFFSKLRSKKLSKWCIQFGLPTLGRFVDRCVDEEIPPEDYWKELANVEASGELVMLQTCLAKSSPADARSFGRLRGLVPGMTSRPKESETPPGRHFTWLPEKKTRKAA